MADGITVDTSELTRLSVNLGRASGAAITASRAVVKKGLDNIKRDTVAHISDDPTWRSLARTVNYEVVRLWGEVGYDDVGQGELAGIYEFGSARRAPHPTLYPAAAREEPKFAAAIGLLTAKTVQETL